LGDIFSRNGSIAFAYHKLDVCVKNTFDKPPPRRTANHVSDTNSNSKNNESSGRVCEDSLDELWEGEDRALWAADRAGQLARLQVRFERTLDAIESLDKVIYKSSFQVFLG